jgi:5-formyltetrahydrofolate cyclo-ligase
MKNPHKTITKEPLRLLLKQRRAAISPELRQQKSREIAANVCRATWWKNAQTVHIYCSFGTEAMTETLRDEALRLQKRVIVPIAEADKSILRHAEIFSATRFIADAWGIPLPTAESSVACNPLHIMSAEDCVIVPLLGFDANRHRLGYGRGYYDRFLGSFYGNTSSKPLYVGLAFAETQYVAEGLPIETTDVPLDGIVTEQGFFGLPEVFGA